MRTRLVVGCGYLGKPVADAYRARGDRVIVTTRSAERARQFQREGFESLVLDVTQRDTLENLPAVDTLFFAVGFDRSAGIDQQRVYVDGLGEVLDAVADVRDRVIYISSTGVYGQHDGEWVDEESRCEPVRTGGRCCLLAEQRLQQHRWGPKSVVLRLAGIYGPQRIPWIDLLRRGEPLEVSTTGYLNLIHRDDAVAVVMAADECELPNLFLVAGGRPVQRADFYREIAARLDVEPKFQSAAAGASSARRGSSSKRARNRKLVNQLGINFRFPDYRAGIADVLAHE